MLGIDPMRPPETDEEPWMPRSSEWDTNYARASRSLSRLATVAAFLGLSALIAIALTSAVAR